MLLHVVSLFELSYRVQDSLKDIQDKLDNLFDVAEYENIAKEIR